MHLYTHTHTHTLSPWCSERALLCKPEEMQRHCRGQGIHWSDYRLFSYSASPLVAAFFFSYRNPSLSLLFVLSALHSPIVFVSLWSTTPSSSILLLSLSRPFLLPSVSLSAFSCHDFSLSASLYNLHLTKNSSFLLPIHLSSLQLPFHLLNDLHLSLCLQLVMQLWSRNLVGNRKWIMGTRRIMITSEQRKLVWESENNEGMTSNWRVWGWKKERKGGRKSAWPQVVYVKWCWSSAIKNRHRAEQEEVI